MLMVRGIIYGKALARGFLNTDSPCRALAWAQKEGYKGCVCFPSPFSGRGFLCVHKDTLLFLKVNYFSVHGVATL